MQWSMSGLLHFTQNPGAEGFPPHACPSLCPTHVPLCCVASCGQRGIQQNSQASKLFKNMTILSGNPEPGPFLISSVVFCPPSLQFVLWTVRALLTTPARGGEVGFGKLVWGHPGGLCSISGCCFVCLLHRSQFDPVLWGHGDGSCPFAERCLPWTCRFGFLLAALHQKLPCSHSGEELEWWAGLGERPTISSFA